MNEEDKRPKIGNYRKEKTERGMLGTIGYTIAAFGYSFGMNIEYHHDEKNFKMINTGILELYYHVVNGFDANCDIEYTPAIYKDSVEYLQYRADSIIGGVNEKDDEYVSSFRCLSIALEDIYTINHLYDDLVNLDDPTQNDFDATYDAIIACLDNAYPFVIASMTLMKTSFGDILEKGDVEDSND